MPVSILADLVQSTKIFVESYSIIAFVGAAHHNIITTYLHFQETQNHILLYNQLKFALRNFASP